MPCPRLPAALLCLGAALVCVPLHAEPGLPAGWLAAATIRDAPATTQTLSGLAQEIGLPAPPDRLLQQLGDPALGLANAAVVVGLAAGDDAPDALFPFALAPTPVETLTALFGGDLTGPVGVFSVGGIEFAAGRRGAATMIVPLERQTLIQAPDAASGGALLDSADQVALRISEAGIDLLKRRLTDRAAARGPRQRVVVTSFAWPPSAKWLDAAVAGNTPLAERVAELFTSIGVGLQIDKQGSLVASLRGGLRDAPTRGASSGPSPAGLPEPPRPPIATAGGSVEDGSLATLAAVWLGYHHGRPDDIESRGYRAAEWKVFEARVLDAVALVGRFEYALLSRQPEDPFYSNQAVLAQCEDPAELRDAVAAVAQAWNAVVGASEPRTPLTIAIDEQPVPGADAALTLSTDVGAALESPPSETTKQIMRRYYGEDGLYVIRAAAVEGGLLIADVDRGSFGDLLAGIKPGQAAAPQPLTGTAHVDRYAAWQNAIRDAYLQDAIGYKPPAELAPAPVGFSLEQAEGVWRVTLRASRQTTVTLGRFFLRHGR